MTPTARAGVVLAGLALAILAIPLWLGIAALIVVLVCTLLDGLSVRDAPPITREVPAVLSRAVPAEVRAGAAAPDGRMVLLRQPPGAALEVSGQTDAGALVATVTGYRRGRHLLPGIASASVGPLGLARVHHDATAASELRVYPDLRTARRLILRLRRTMASLAGGAARGPLGLGTEFESIRDYSADDDIRQLNWTATARLGRPMSNQYRVERDREVVSLLDCGRLAAATIGAGSVLDVGLDVATVVALAADELGDRYGAVVFDAEVHAALAPRHLGGRAAIEALFDLESRSVESNFERAVVRVSASRRALVFVHTDLVDEAAARSLAAGMSVLARRHAVVVATPADPVLSQIAESGEDLARAVVALDVLQARRQAVIAVRRAGAQVVEAPPERLAERCLDAYIRVKLRGGL